jgi:uncharacterized repeat protein (TIGR02543 family)
LPENKKGNKYINVILKVILSLLLGIMMLVSVCVFILLTVFHQNNVEAFVREIDPVWVIEDMGLQGVVAEYLNDIPHFHPVFNASGVEEFLKRDAVVNELDNIVDGYLSAFFIGDLNHHVTYDDVMAITRRLEPDIYEQFGIELTNEYYWILSITLDRAELYESLTIGHIIEVASIDISYLDYLYSAYLLAALGTLCILFIFNVFIVHWKSIAGSFLVVGIPLSLAGSLLAVAGTLAVQYITNLDQSLSTIARFVESPASLLYQRGMYVAIGGAALIVISIALFILFKVIKKRRSESISERKKYKVKLFVGIGVNAALVATILAFLAFVPTELEAKATADAQARAEAVADISDDAVMHTVTFDANEGSWLAGEFEIRTAVVGDGAPVGASLPHDPVREGYIFRGWMDASINPFSDQQPITDDVTFRALWIDESLNNDIIEFVELVEELTNDLNTSLSIVEVFDSDDLVYTGCVVSVSNNDPNNEITIVIDKSLTLYEHTTWQFAEGINLEFINSANFTIDSGVVYENLGMMNFKHMTVLNINDGAVFSNLGTIELSTARVNTVHSRGKLINDGNIISISAFLRIAGFAENNGYMNIARNPDYAPPELGMREIYGGHFWIEDFDIGEEPEVMFVNNGEIVIADNVSAFDVRTGIFVNNGIIENNGGFRVFADSELIIGSEGVFENNRVLRNHGTITTEDGGRINGRRITN